MLLCRPDFLPVEILFFRFVLGFFTLLLVFPRPLKGTTPIQECMFVAAGPCGICLYYLLENRALTFTMVSNVGVIISMAPFFTALLTHFFMKGEEKLRVNFFLGFGVAMAGAGILLILVGLFLSERRSGEVITWNGWK